MPSGPCSGTDYSCHSLADATKLVFKYAEGIKPSAQDAAGSDGASTDRQGQQVELFRKVKAQQLCKLVPLLLSASKQLLDRGHSDAVLLELAKTFYRCVLLRGEAGYCRSLLCMPHSSQADTPAHAAVLCANCLKKNQMFAVLLLLLLLVVLLDAGAAGMCRHVAVPISDLLGSGTLLLCVPQVKMARNMTRTRQQPKRQVGIRLLR